MAGFEVLCRRSRFLNIGLQAASVNGVGIGDVKPMAYGLRLG